MPGTVRDMSFLSTYQRGTDAIMAGLWLSCAKHQFVTLNPEPSSG